MKTVLDIKIISLEELRESYQFVLENDLSQPKKENKNERKFLCFYNYISRNLMLDENMGAEEILRFRLEQTWYYIILDYLLENKWLEFFDNVYASLDTEYETISIGEFRKILFGNENDGCSIKKEELRAIDDTINCLRLHKCVELYEEDGIVSIRIPSYMKDIVIGWGKKLYCNENAIEWEGCNEKRKKQCNYRNLYNNWDEKYKLYINNLDDVKKIMASEWTLSEQLYSILGEEEQKKIREININKAVICKILIEKIKWNFDDANWMDQSWTDDLLVQIENVLVPWASSQTICVEMSKNIAEEINTLHKNVLEISEWVKKINDDWRKNAEIFKKENYFEFIECEDIAYIEAVENFSGLFSSFMISWIMVSCKYVSDKRSSCSRITKEQFEELLDILNKAPISFSIGKAYLLCEVLSFLKVLLNHAMITEKIMKVGKECVGGEKYEKILIESMIRGIQITVEEYIARQYENGLAENDMLSNEIKEKTENIYRENMKHLLNKIKESKDGCKKASKGTRSILAKCFKDVMQHNIKNFTKI